MISCEEVRARKTGFSFFYFVGDTLLRDTNGIPLGIPSAYQMETQDRLGKDRIGKVSIGQESIVEYKVNA